MPTDLLANVAVSGVTAAGVTFGVFYARYRIAYRRERARAGLGSRVRTTKT